MARCDEPILKEHRRLKKGNALQTRKAQTYAKNYTATTPMENGMKGNLISENTEVCYLWSAAEEEELFLILSREQTTIESQGNSNNFSAEPRHTSMNVPNSQPCYSLDLAEKITSILHMVAVVSGRWQKRANPIIKTWNTNTETDPKSRMHNLDEYFKQSTVLFPRPGRKNN